MMNKKKILFTVLSTVMATSMMLAGIPALAATQFHGEATTGVNVRTAPSVKSSKTGQLKKGEAVVIVSKVSKGNEIGGVTADLNYYKLQTGGYVAAEYIKVTGTSNEESSDATATNGATETKTTTATTTTESETETNDLSSIKLADDEEDSSEETTEDTTSEEDTTSTSDEGDDDVMIIEDKTTTTTTTTTTTSEEEKTETVDATHLEAKKMQIKDAVNVRIAPSKNAEVETKLAKGAIVTTIRKYSDGDTYQDVKVTGTWYQLNSGGFVSSDYLEDAKTTTITSSKSEGTTTSASSQKTATAKTDATLYSSPNTLSNQSGTMKKGTTKNITASYPNGSTYNAWKVSGSWYKLSDGLFVQDTAVTVSGGGSSTAGASASFLTSSLPAATFFKVGDGVQMKKNVNMRKGPATSYGVVKLLQSGDTAVIQQVIPSGSTADGKTVAGTWVKVTTEYGTGYIHSDYIGFDSGVTVQHAVENGGVGGIGATTTTNTTTTKSTTEKDATQEQKDLAAELKEE